VLLLLLLRQKPSPAPLTRQAWVTL